MLVAQQQDDSVDCELKADGTFFTAVRIICTTSSSKTGESLPME